MEAEDESFVDDVDQPLEEVVEERPGAVLAAVDVGQDDDRITRDRLITVIVGVAREEGINLARVINDHPEAVEEQWGQSIELDEEAVALVEDALEGRLG